MYNMVDLESLISGTRKVEYLPKWAQEEKLYNCDNTWKGIQKSFFFRYISNLFS